MHKLISKIGLNFPRGFLAKGTNFKLGESNRTRKSIVLYTNDNRGVRKIELTEEEFTKYLNIIVHLQISLQ